MNIDHLRYILEISNCGSINQAAENLNFQRQYLSKILSNVEKQYGISIFERKPKGVEPTKDGLYFINAAEKIVAQMDELERHFLQFNATYPNYRDEIFFYMPDLNSMHLATYNIIKDFGRQFPNVRLSLITKSTGDVIDAIKEHPMIPGAFFASSEQIVSDDEKIVILPLKSVLLVAITSSKNPLAKRYKSISLEKLGQQELVFYENEKEEPSILYPPCCIELLKNRAKYHVNSINHFYGFLEQKNCFSISLFNSEVDNDGRFLQIPLDENLSTTLYMAYHRDALQVFPIKSFLNKILTYYDKPYIL